MLYALIGDDAPGSLEKRLAARPAHIERLKALQDAGHLILAGPCPAIDSPDPGPAGFVGSLIVAEFDSLAEAQAWLAADPYVTEGVFARMRVLPFKKAFPA
ncbi:MAG: YciI family protein [Sulfuritalea sp.]|nr:YciI family protein [Sulfuritalea sp.]